jgi:hypothetical protein
MKNPHILSVERSAYSQGFEEEGLARKNSKTTSGNETFSSLMPDGCGSPGGWGFARSTCVTHFPFSLTECTCRVVLIWQLGIKHLLQGVLGTWGAGSLHLSSVWK